jgi:hypothetical protein
LIAKNEDNLQHAKIFIKEIYISNNHKQSNCILAWDGETYMHAREDMGTPQGPRSIALPPKKFFATLCFKMFEQVVDIMVFMPWGIVFKVFINTSVATGNFVREWAVRDRPGIDGTGKYGKFSSGNWRYGKVREIFVRELTVRESTGNFRPGIDGTGKYGKFSSRNW